MTRRKITAKTRWAAYVSQHRCGCCGVALPEGYEHKTCEKCLARGQQFYEKCKEVVRCPKCGETLPDSSYVLCETCRAKASRRMKDWREAHKDRYNKRQRDYYTRRRAEHLCVRCGEPLPEGWAKALCQACADWQKMRRLSG